ncbi:phosphosulfolactate synthase [Nocardioides daejeonensis]|uniref:phosphosulfolactate synthase n=1 Tax=Nocardioides daejeonensis TaxID=1046556 RepID=UPI000D74A12B|nr:phosphosulfolactate synthase [Nocardioides daejeonensis]
MVHELIQHSKQGSPVVGIAANFLRLPARGQKPRARGLSHVLDNGISPSETRDRLEAAARTIDLWKFGWGIAYLDPHLSEKVRLLTDHQVLACPGGTLAEVAWRQGQYAAFLDWAEAAGFPAIEVSNGTVTMSRTEKDDLIGTAAERFVVLAEVGRKDPALELAPEEWSTHARADIAAGATWVVAEGRESGTVGLFTPDGQARADVVEAIVASIGLPRVLFEAPQRAQQAWLIRRFGPEVNLGNIALSDALALETLRLGLRADTLDASFAYDPTRQAER